jgi:hypothetical protein
MAQPLKAVRLLASCSDDALKRKGVSWEKTLANKRKAQGLPPLGLPCGGVSYSSHTVVRLSNLKVQVSMR